MNAVHSLVCGNYRSLKDILGIGYLSATRNANELYNKEARLMNVPPIFTYEFPTH